MFGQAGELWVGWKTRMLALGVWMEPAMRMINQFPIGMNKLTLQGKSSRGKNVSPYLPSSSAVTTFSRRKTPVPLSKSECWGEYAFQFVLIPRV